MWAFFVNILRNNSKMSNAFSYLHLHFRTLHSPRSYSNEAPPRKFRHIDDVISWKLCCDSPICILPFFMLTSYGHCGYERFILHTQLIMNVNVNAHFNHAHFYWYITVYALNTLAFLNRRLRTLLYNLLILIWRSSNSNFDKRVLWFAAVMKNMQFFEM